MSLRTQAQAFGAKLSGMVVPNLGAFMAWGFLTALGVAFNSDLLKSFIVPMLNYLLPLLIAFAGGRMVYDYRGGVIAAVVTIGVIIGSDVTMFIGAMIMGPLAAYTLKQFDKLLEGKIPVGFELIVNNFSIGIIGSLLAVVSKVYVAPSIAALTGFFSNGVNFLVNKNLLPLTAIFIEPAKVLFLNNAIGQGILSPLGAVQLSSMGKSVLFLLESNPGPGMGILLAYMIFGKNNSKSSAYGASVIHFFGGIHEIYFPFVLMNPILILPLILGGMTGTFLFSLLKVGLIGIAAPGSILAIMIMSAPGDNISILLAVLGAAVVAFVTAIPFVKIAQNDDIQLSGAAQKMENFKGKKSSVSSIFDFHTTDFSIIKRIAFACDAGVGSSLMGASALQKKIRQAEINHIEVFHVAVSSLPVVCDLIVTHESLAERVKEQQPDTPRIIIQNFLNDPEYDRLIANLRKQKTVNRQ